MSALLIDRHCPSALPIQTQYPSICEQNASMKSTNVVSDPADVNALKNLAGRDDLSVEHIGFECAGREFTESVAAVLRFPAGALCAPSDPMQGSKEASWSIAGSSRMGTLHLQCCDPPLAHFLTSTAVA